LKYNNNLHEYHSGSNRFVTNACVLPSLLAIHSTTLTNSRTNEPFVSGTIIVFDAVSRNTCICPKRWYLPTSQDNTGNFSAIITSKLKLLELTVQKHADRWQIYKIKAESNNGTLVVIYGGNRCS
jgi:hypothetical protein